MSGTFQNAVVVITGAGSGIGRATALAFAKEGARVHAVDINKERLDELKTNIEKLGQVCHSYIVDCCQAEALEQLAAEVYEREARVDVLFNNAGVGHASPIEDTSLEDWRWVLDLNLYGVIYGIHAFLPRLIAQGGDACIVNTASMAGLLGAPRMAPYCASKFAVVGLSESLHIELQNHKISVTAVCPGLIRTNILDDGRLHENMPDRAEVQRRFMKYAGSAETVAAKVLKACRKKRPLQTVAKLFLMIWLLKRLSLWLYFALSKWGDRRMLRQAKDSQKPT